MTQTFWFVLAYGAGLFYLLLNKDKIADVSKFRQAWMQYTMAIFTEFAFTVFRAVNYASPQKMLLVEIWAKGISWLFIGLSLLALLKAILPDGDESEINEFEKGILSR